MLSQAVDFRDESEALYKILEPLSEEDFERKTLFKEWTLNDILQHLHFFNYAAELSRTDEERFLKEYGELKGMEAKGKSMVEATNIMLDGLRGRKLLQAWRDYYVDVADRWVEADPKQRVKWAGPDMSVRSSVTARLMETWSHAQAIYDLLGIERENTDLIKNVVVIGVNTFGWTFVNRGEEVPSEIPYIKLTAPSGELWEWNDPSETNYIEGSAAEFSQVVTQTRNIGDTSLTVVGEPATKWMAVAQCFAGPPRNPPAVGQRRAAR